MKESRLRGCLVRLLKVAGILLLLLIGAMAYGRVTAQREIAELEPPGRLVSVDGRQVHVRCLGEGVPMTIVDAGNASFSLDWAGIQPGLAEITRVCVFDRPGYGWSDPAETPRDAEHAAAELHALIRALESGPVVLVGHSLGGLHALLFAATYPDDLAGLVLVDPPHPDSIETPEYAQLKAQSMGFYTSMRLLAASGLLRSLGGLGGEEGLPETARRLPEVREPYLLLTLKPALWDTAIAELQEIETSAGQLRSALSGPRPLGDLPLVVLSAGRDPDVPADYRARRTAEQAHLAALSTRGEHRTLPESGHLVQFDDPEAIVAAVRDVIAQARE